ncbi:MFS transporter [Sulfuricystis multivorans]|uniref:MFS transporter n=1 Tax=Sulfuricystis multivorans TaxID=2211108 RepID=UPI000F842849|nr:MFS transporter [Sulfuricystis multivorans]
MNPPPLRLAWTVWGLGALFYLFAFYQRVAPAVMTDQLMAEFAIGGAALGNLSAFYFYAYVAMQIPTGVLADRFGPRHVLAVGSCIAALGSLLFAFAPGFGWAAFGRLLVGASVAVAFVSTLKLASHWFPPQKYALASGMALFFGVAGGIMAGVPLRLLVEHFGWRIVMGSAGLFAILLCAAIWLLVRDDPAERGYASHHAHDGAQHGHPPILAGLIESLSYRNTWLLMLAPIGFSGAVLTFGGLWGVPWLRQVHGLDPKAAAAVTSTLLAAWALGGPLLGNGSQKLGRRKPLYLVSGVVATVGWALVIFLPLPLWLLIPLLIVIGFASGNIIIGFAWAKESVPLRLMGTTSGVVNMGPLLGGVILQPGVGWLLDRSWSGAQQAGARLYDAATWQTGFALMFASVLIALLLVPFIRETHCRQAG